MGPKTTNFQVAILIIFGFFILLGVVLFSTSKLKPGTDVVDAPVVMWGTLSSEVVSRLTEKITADNKVSLQLTYVQKKPASFEKDLVEAIADGSGPDIVLISQDMIAKNTNKFVTISFATYSLRTFKDSFVDVGSVYLKSDGAVAIPFIVDPMVMYWNKTHFVNASVVNPPKEWSEFSEIVKKLTKKDSNFNIMQSGTALGEYQNILHAKDILSMLFLQAGAKIVTRNPDDSYRSSLYSNSSLSDKPAGIIALSFYTDFANPAKDSYTWNKSLKPSLDSFTSGDTSIYFGYASELAGISLKNPNLNFDVAKVPQVTGANKKSVFARIYGLAILKSSKSQNSAFNHIKALTSADSISVLSELTNLPPVRKDVLTAGSADPYMQIFNDSALIADTWIDPNSSDTDIVFKKMIESVIIGRESVDSAVNIADGELRNVIVNNIKIK